MNKSKVIFLDRDGVIFESVKKHEYILNYEDAHFICNSPQAIKLLNDIGYKVVVVTNQRCVALGKINAKELENIHIKMKQHIYHECGGIISDIYVCTHNIGECNCRKPKTGLLKMANKKYNVNKETSWMIGDCDSDIQAGIDFGVLTVAINNKNINANLHATTLWEAANKLYYWEREKIDGSKSTT